MSAAISSDIPAMRTEPDGTIRVGTSRVTLDTVITAFRHGATPDAIVSRFPTVTLADADAVIAHYLRNPEPIDQYLAERERQADELQREIEARQGDQPGLRERLLARKKAAG